MNENEQVYEFQPPKPYHPQSRFGSGVQAADRAWPNLAAYYGEGFQVNFTTWDLLDSLAARVKELEDEEMMGREIARRYDAQTKRMVQDIFGEPEQPVKPGWLKRLLFRLRGWSK